MGKTYRHGSGYESREPRFSSNDEFRCRQCKSMVGATLWGGRNRNHCPFCLHSRHVDGKTPGDRASRCGSIMAPIASFERRKGEQAIVHRCLGCGFERHCRVAADDDFVLVTKLPVVRPRPARDDGQQPLEMDGTA